MLKIPSQLPKLFLKMTGVKYGKNLKCFGWPFILRRGDARITIGDNCRINSNFLSNPGGLCHRTAIIAYPGANIEIGDGCGMSGITVYSFAEVKIGNNVVIGSNTRIADTDFHPLMPDARREQKGVDHSMLNDKPVIIHDNCFIGWDVIILKGCELGENCVVGAGSVVRGKFPPNSIIAGNPAKVIKTLDFSKAPNEKTAEALNSDN